MDIKIYSGCPCLLCDGDKSFCLNESELTEVLLVNSKGFPPRSGGQRVCYNAVMEGEDGYLLCPSTGKHVKVRGRKVESKVFSEVYNAVKLVFADPTLCTQCLYNMLSERANLSFRNEVNAQNPAKIV